jgi:hypothetical protein
MNARLSRISTLSVVAGSSTVLMGAAAVMLTAGLAFADNADTIDRSMDLPVEAPIKQEPVKQKAPPPVTSQSPVDSVPPPQFFGHDLTNTGSVVYVIDQSGSMSLTVASFVDSTGKTVTNGSRMDRAKSELTKSIQSLPQSFTFNVIFYDECVRPWQQANVPANAGNKSAAYTFIAQQQPMGFTNTGLAVATALHDKSNKSVVLLSDGEPNFLDCACNYVGTYAEHENLIKQANTQNANVTCFGIGVAGDAAAREFMIAVAGQNSGTYIQID